ncbi:MAG: ATP-binding protein [Fretibacterium sp.]|nr:ATP-binding protein [Fretibacterium sp.]
MPVMAIMIGIQASGKSQFAMTYLKSYTRINLDTLHTRNKEKLALEAAIKNREDIVIDNTNPTIKERARYISAVLGHGYKVEGYFMQSKLQDCIERNEQRPEKEKIPRHAIAATSNKLELPDYEEGFDSLYFVSFAGDKTEIQEWRAGE